MTLKDELIAAIQNEDLTFDMSMYCIGYVELRGVEAIPSCHTARCMAGHIEALRPARAAEIAAEWGGMTPHMHAVVAAKIWKEEMREICRLDFLGDNYDFSTDIEGLEGITRQEAVAHINGVAEWTQLADDQLMFMYGPHVLSGYDYVR